MGATDSKLAFRKGVFRLFEERHIPPSDDYWSLFWTIPETADDVFSLIGASDVRRARDNARENLETLIDKTIDRMEAITNAPNFPSAQYSINHLLNCCRIMTRIMPYIYESPECSEWEDSFFWTPRLVEKKAPENSEDETIKGTFDEQQQQHQHQQQQEPVIDTKPQPQYDTLPPRGEVFLSLVIRCLFLAGFTLPISMTTKDSRVVYAIWEAGVGSSKEIGTYKDNEMNRTEVLRLLTVLLSKSMYISSSQLLSKEDLWLRFVAAKTERKIVLVVLCSLMNTACKYDPIGWGVPYNHVLIANPREKLVTMCLRVLLILLDYRSPRISHWMRHIDQQQTKNSLNGSTADVEENDIQNAPDQSAGKLNAGTPEMNDSEHFPVETSTITAPIESINESEGNVFRHYLSKLHRSQDFEFLMDGMYRILLNPLQASNTYLPGSTKRVECNIEVMMLCWRVMEINLKFRTYLMETERALDLMVVLIYYTMENRSNVAQVGLVRMCTFILQTLSSDRTFGVKLNKQFVSQSYLPALIRIPASHGTYGDFLIISIFSLIATTRGTLSTLYPALVLTISNVSPYLKNLSVTSSSKLVGLFSSISAPGFLLADESNYRLLSYLIEAFNNIIQYQFTDNPNFVYAIVRNHAKFERLRDLSFTNALAEIERLRQLKESKIQTDQGPEENKSVVETNNGPDVNKSQESLAENPSSPRNTGSNSEGNSEESQAIQNTKLFAQGLSESPEGQDFSRTPQRQGSISSTISTPSVLPGAKHGFVPTEEWWSRWHSQLPLQPILLLLEHLVPQVEAKCAAESLTTDAQVLEFLRQITLVGILPHPQPIFIRKFQWGEALFIWFRSMLWGQAYVSSLSEYGAWNGTQVKLFQIKQQVAPTHQQRQSSENPTPSPRISLASNSQQPSTSQ
ncbi:high-temperature-induced dauer-formation protein-domain-containing protein [Phycomyces blakesleeanus]|uniref:High-temperature-induced dauer-formation protein-domain-containing protein n=1 Tax=Phycomyces blakesleeanus TaxID=4837 RepID=A0ABR3BG07_PHYBL